MKYYHMIIGKEWEEAHGDTSTRREYTSKKQGAAPSGWRCIGVCGCFEKPDEKPVSIPSRR